MKCHPVAGAVLGCLLLVTGAEAAPKIGDKAPKIKTSKWLTSAPPALPGEPGAEKHVFLVEFWATWCGPCKSSIPHLAELHRRHQKDGLVVLGISNEDVETIEKYLTKGKKPDMPYHVAADDDMATNNAWMEDVPGIPHAFLVDKSNTVLWTGHPMDDEMEAALGRILAGTYDVAAAKKAAEANEKFEKLMEEANAAYQAGEKDKLFKLIDDMSVVKPREVKPYLMKRHLLAQFERSAEIPSLDAKMEEAMKDHAAGLRQIVEYQFEQALADRNAGMLLRCARRAVELTKESDAELLSFLARVECEFGMVDRAIATQEKAVSQAPPDVKEDLRRVVAYYKEIKRMSQAGQ